MKNYGTDEVDEPIILISEETRWRGFEQVIQPSGGNRQCFYCNAVFECGHDDCVWQEGCA